MLMLTFYDGGTACKDYRGGCKKRTQATPPGGIQNPGTGPSDTVGGGRELLSEVLCVSSGG